MWVKAELTEHGYSMVTEINMSHCKLRGRLTRDVGQLLHLKKLHIAINDLQGMWRELPFLTITKDVFKNLEGNVLFTF